VERLFMAGKKKIRQITSVMTFRVRGRTNPGQPSSFFLQIA
jgi:hypothetical protein